MVIHTGTGAIKIKAVFLAFTDLQFYFELSQKA